ncbi:MAG: hypothetical protein PHH07_04235 [Candidatus Cloacimonetes bacterium]|nr:hypothetical protein [Candidatus Cloacimonadota bacterium]NLH93031.1 hypothetical protein [Candidatus Cloacimonadota bacterium]
MLYSLPDGRCFELEQVSRVSRIRDEGMGFGPVDYSKLTFRISLRVNEVVEVTLLYLYSDWVEQKKKLASIRADLLKKLRDNGINVDDS